MEQFLCPIREAAINAPESIAFVVGKRLVDYLLVDSLVSAFAIQLQGSLSNILNQQLNPLPGRIGILAPNGPALATAIYSLRRLGVTPVPLNLRLAVQDWKAQIEAARLSAMLVTKESLEIFQNYCPVVNLDELYSLSESSAVIGQEKNLSSISYARGQEGIVIFTSGSTGVGKGVVHSVSSCHASANGSNQFTKLSNGDRWLVSLPLFHAGGLGIVQRCVQASAACVFADSLSAADLLDGIVNQGVTHLSLVPTMLADLISYAESTRAIAALNSLKAVLLAGAPSSETLLDKIIELRLPVVGAYGMTETNAHCTCVPLGVSREFVKTVGIPFNGTAVQICNSDGQEVLAGQLGEVVISGPTLMTSYLDPGQTEKAIRLGKLYTGDLGRVDRQGYLTLHGRVDRMFISGGENIYPEEIEQAAFLNPAVKSCAVLATEHPRWGKRPILFVELKTEFQADARFSDKLGSELETRLARIKLPDAIYVIEKLPTTGIGKVDYAALAKYLVTNS